MVRPALAAALLALLATGGRAEEREACLPLAGIGRRFAPEGAPARRLASSRQAIAAYGLGQASREKGVVVL